MGTPCSRSAIPSALEKTILFFEATATESPGHFVALNRASTSASSRPERETELSWARAPRQITRTNVNEPIRAHTVPCSRFLAAEEDSITINVDCFIAIKLTDSVSKAVKRGWGGERGLYPRREKRFANRKPGRPSGKISLSCSACLR